MTKFDLAASAAIFLTSAALITTALVTAVAWAFHVDDFPSHRMLFASTSIAGFLFFTYLFSDNGVNVLGIGEKHDADDEKKPSRIDMNV